MYRIRHLVKAAGSRSTVVKVLNAEQEGPVMCAIKPDRIILFRPQREHKVHLYMQHNGSNNNSTRVLVWDLVSCRKAQHGLGLNGCLEVQTLVVEFRT